MGFLQGETQLSGQGVPRPLKTIDPDLSFGAGMLPQVQPSPNIIQELLMADKPLVGPMSDIPDMGTPDISSAGKPRRSVIDIIGRLSDVVADVGGAKPLYMLSMDADTARARDETAAGWQEKFNTQRFDRGGQEIKRGEQEIASGDLAIDQAEASRMGQAVRGLDAVFKSNGVAGLAKAWPMVAKTLGIPEEEQAAFAAELAKDPEGVITALNASLNPEKSQGSLPKEIQIYEMLKAKDPEKAEEYLAAVASGDKGITEYQMQQLGLGRDRLALTRETARERAAIQRERLRQGGAGKPGGPKIPAAVQKQYLGNRDSLRQITAAKELLDANPDSVGAQYAVLPDIISQRTNPTGVSTRAAISNIGSLLIHDRSGATVTVAESPRLRPFIPSASDTPDAIRRKLDNLAKIIEENNTDIDEYYSGNSAPASKPKPRRAAPRRPASKPAASSGGWGKATVVKP